MVALRLICFRPSQLVYLDKKGYRLALDSSDESSFIQARNGVIDISSGKKIRETSSNSTSEGPLTKSSSDNIMNEYDESEAKGDAERDESIDYNMGWDEFPEEPKR